MAKDFYVYLCGPMAANTPEQANGWRLNAFDLLEPHGITVVSPMREKDMMKNSTLMGVDYTTYGDVPELRAASIYARDTYDVSHANAILANFTDLGRAVSGEPIPSLGSDWEMGYAAALGIRIVLVAPPENYYRKHPFSLAGSSIIFDTLEPACAWLVKNFRPYRNEEV
jgi:nucleoside 2-deoxyribosyltransferase